MLLADVSIAMVQATVYCKSNF